jgi:hypothetical protein
MSNYEVLLELEHEAMQVFKGQGVNAESAGKAAKQYAESLGHIVKAVLLVYSV